MQLSPQKIAQVCHEANRAVQIITADQVVSPQWDMAPGWQRESAIDGVKNALAGASPEQSHDNWREFKEANGWVYGPVKDEEKKTHPCLVPYDELPDEQKVKDHLFTAIVQTLAPYVSEQMNP